MNINIDLKDNKKILQILEYICKIYNLKYTIEQEKLADSDWVVSKKYPDYEYYYNFNFDEHICDFRLRNRRTKKAIKPYYAKCDNEPRFHINYNGHDAKVKWIDFIN